jgi:tetratricopeptide (TPR) repeat protein
MEEFTHTLLESGSIVRKERQYVLSRTPSEIRVPDTIQGIIAARMDRLEENLKRTMQVASVIGRDFAFRILQTITGMREELKAYLLNLQGLEFIYEKQLFPELEYIFKHALTQEVAYNNLLVKRRSEIHKRIGEAIEALYPERLEEFYEILAYHYAKGEDPQKACRYLRRSGDKATRNHALTEAYGFYREALGLLDQRSETEDNREERIEVIECMKIPIGLLGFSQDSLAFFQQGERLAKELGDTRRLAVFYSAMGLYYTHAGNPSMALRYTEDAFAEARKTPDLELMVPLAYSLCITYMWTGDLSKITNVAPGVIDLLEKTGRESEFFAAGMSPYCSLCGTYGISLGQLGNFAEGKTFLQKALREATQVNDLATLGMAELNYGGFFYIKGDWESAKEHLEKSIQHSEAAKFHLISAVGLSFLGSVYSRLGNPETGRRHAEKGLHIHRESGIQALLSTNYLLLGAIHLDLGDLEKARSCAEEALRLSRKNNEKTFEGSALIWLGRILGKRGPRQAEKVEECIFQGLEILRDMKRKPHYAQGYLFLGEFYLDAGEKEKAAEHLKKAEGMFLEMGMDYWLDRTRKLLERL